MKIFNLQIGMSAEKSETVTTSNTAKAYGSGSIDVYATPAMIGLMEGASLTCVDPMLPQGMSTVGTKLEIKHLAATSLGMTVTAKAELMQIEGKKLFFKVFAVDNHGIIGEGTHERFIVDIEKFLKKAKEK